MKVQNILDESYGDCRHKEDKRSQLFVMKSKRSLQFAGLFVWSCNKLAIPKSRKNAAKEGFVMKRRLKGAHCQHCHCLPIVACNDLLGSVQKRQGEARGEESDKLCKLPPLVLHLNPSLENDTARISARACRTDPARGLESAYERRVPLFAMRPRYHTTYYSHVT